MAKRKNVAENTKDIPSSNNRFKVLGDKEEKDSFAEPKKQKLEVESKVETCLDNNDLVQKS